MDPSMGSQGWTQLNDLLSIAALQYCVRLCRTVSTTWTRAAPLFWISLPVMSPQSTQSCSRGRTGGSR